MAKRALDTLWPSGSRLPVGKPKPRPKAKERIERFFSELYGCDAIVLPSGRAAISLILAEEGFSRGDYFHAPEWSSHCVWNSITPYCNPTTSLDSRCRGALLVHKFGLLSQAPASFTGLLVEDSCDSLLLDGGALFPSGGKYELVSFPKVMGIFAGGLVLTRDGAAAKRLRAASAKVGKLANRQSEGRLRHAQGKDDAHAWEDTEYLNFAPSPLMLSEIERGLGFFSENALEIHWRLDKIRERGLAAWLPEGRLQGGRLPCQWPVPVGWVPAGNGSFEIRRLNLRGTAAEPRFEPFALLPLHFGVPRTAFLRLVDSVRMGA